MLKKNCWSASLLVDEGLFLY